MGQFNSITKIIIYLKDKKQDIFKSLPQDLEVLTHDHMG